MSIKVVIQGAAGRMGKTLIRFIQEQKVAGLELAAFIDVEGNLAGGYRHIADAAFNAQAASRQFEILAHGRATQGHRLDRGRQPEPDMHNVISRRQHQSRRGGLFFADQLECTAGLGLGGVDAPG